MENTQPPQQSQRRRLGTAKRGLSITQKLVALIVLTSGAIIALLTTYFFNQQRYAAESALERKATNYGRLVSKEVASAIAFDDQETAREVFDSIAQDQDIESLVLMRAAGTTLYSRGEPGAWVADARGGVTAQRVLHVGDRIAVIDPVVSAEGPRGTLVIELSTSTMLENNRRLLRTALVAAGLSLLFGALLAYGIARSFGKRLASISSVANEVTIGELAHEPVQVSGTDEIAQLGHAFNAMLEHIQSLVREIRTRAEGEQARLERLVQARTHELHHRNAEMRLVLDNVDQGFVGVDLHGAISPERSAIVSTWLGNPNELDTLFSWIERSFEGNGARFSVAWDGLGEEWMPLEMRIDQLPRELHTGETWLAFTYKPVLDDDNPEMPSKLLVVITDTTAFRAKQRAEGEERELAQIVRKLLEDRVGFREFVIEADELVGAIETRTDGLARMRDLHTLKGNAAIFGFTSLSGLCHELENAAHERTTDLAPEELRVLRSTWTRLQDKVLSLTGTRSSAVEVSTADYEQLLARIDAHAPPSQLRALMETWQLEPVGARLSRLAEYARTLSDRLDKGPLEVRVEPNDVRLDPHAWGQVWQAITHVVRNAVDHGLETADERAAHQRSETGLLVLRTTLKERVFKLEIEDNGRGIDWERLAGIARSRGLPDQTREDMTEALWADGVTTREVATDTSGRGVGLSAVKQVCTETGGRIHVQSELGRGTRFSFEWEVDEACCPKLREATHATERFSTSGGLKSKYVKAV